MCCGLALNCISHDRNKVYSIARDDLPKDQFVEEYVVLFPLLYLVKAVTTYIVEQVHCLLPSLVLYLKQQKKSHQRVIGVRLISRMY